MNFKTISRRMIFCFLAIAGFGVAIPAGAQGIEQLLLETIPIPTPRPTYGSSDATGASQPDPTPDPMPVSRISAPVSGASSQPINAVSGSLRKGLDALGKKDTVKARSIAAGMASASLDRKILSWAIALSGQPGVTSSEISMIAGTLPDWPGQAAMRSNAEKALSRESLSARAIIRAFAGRKPESLTGAIMLAKAYLDTANKRAANAIIAPFWREEKLDKASESKLLASVGQALTRADHRYRMHRQFYRDRTKSANRVAKYTDQASLAKARTAVVRKSSNAGKLLKAVAATSKRDPGFLFASIQQARRSEDYRLAARLILKTPRDKTSLVYPNEWWVEQRLISRHMLNLGDARTAYKIVASHSANSPGKIADAEFHAGWYALRYLNKPKTARQHFANILKVSSRPISVARGHYWLGRASSGAKARKHYQEAAKHTGTFYGQLAAANLGKRSLAVSKPRPTSSERARFTGRTLVQAIKRLKTAGYGWRTDIIYRHLAGVLNSPGEIALLSADAERGGSPSLALQIGKIAHGRGLKVDTLSWPIGAIPNSAKIGKSGRALAYSIARQESAFNPRAVSPANARGLLQLLPGTAKQVARKIGTAYSYKRLTSDPAYNATLGAAYLSEQLDNFDNSYILTFAGYNAGPGRVREWIETYGDPRGKPLEQVIDWIERIPFTETRNYVQRVMENYQVYKARIDKSQFDIERDLVSGRR